MHSGIVSISVQYAEQLHTDGVAGSRLGCHVRSGHESDVSVLTCATDQSETTCSNSCPSTGWYRDAATTTLFTWKGMNLRRHRWVWIFCRPFTKFIKFLLSGPTLKTKYCVCVSPAQSAETDRVHKHQNSLLYIVDGRWCRRKRGSRDGQIRVVDRRRPWWNPRKLRRITHIFKIRWELRESNDYLWLCTNIQTKWVPRKYPGHKSA